MINDKIELTDEQIRHLPLFFKITYHNKLIDPKFEKCLMFTNTLTNQEEMRSIFPLRPWGKLFDVEKVAALVSNERDSCGASNIKGAVTPTAVK